MYNETKINQLIQFVKETKDCADKEVVVAQLKEKFKLKQDGKVFYLEKTFAIRISYSTQNSPSNTILALSHLKSYDEYPFFVLVVFQNKENEIFISNSSFLKKISHSSQNLAIDNIKGSFNFSDIRREVGELSNIPDNFHKLFDIHSEYTFSENLERLVESTGNIKPQKNKYDIKDKNSIFHTIDKSIDFINSQYFDDLENDLSERVNKVQNEIIIASLIDSVNLRGRIIEYLITDNGSETKTALIQSLKNHSELPEFTTKDGLGDYEKTYQDKYDTKTDIKTKILYLTSNPKAYDIDKFLEFAAQENAVYLIYIVGINDNDQIKLKLCSVFDTRLKKASICSLWSGRLTRGHVQFDGQDLDNILQSEEKTQINSEQARKWLEKLINL